MEGEGKIRPYFLSPELDWASLPSSVQSVIASLIEPAYQELVLNAATAFERLAGSAVVFLATVEIVEQLVIGRELIDSAGDLVPPGADAMIRALRVRSAREKADRLLLQIRRLPRRPSPSPGDAPWKNLQL